MKYPHVVLKLDQNKKNRIIFDIHLNDYMQSCITLEDKRHLVRRILNPNYPNNVRIYTGRVKENSHFYREIESLDYWNGCLYYTNQHLKCKIPFSKANVKTLQDYDYQLERYYMDQEGCCVLY